MRNIMDIEQEVSLSSNVTGLQNNTGIFQDFYLQARFITGLILYPIFCLFGLVGNIICIIVFAKSLTSSTTVLLLGLSVSDLIKIISDVLYFATILIMHVDKDSGQKMYTSVYPYAHYIFHTSMCTSAWITVFVAAERFICVRYPAKAKMYCLVRYAARILIPACFFIALLNIPFWLKYESVAVVSNNTLETRYHLGLSTLWSMESFKVPFVWLQYGLRSIIPLISLIILNSSVITGIRSCKFSKRSNTTITLIVVIVVFTVLSLPDAIMSTVLGFGYHEEDFLAKGIREITDFLLLLNAVSNCLIYCIFNNIFRANLTRLWCFKFMKQQGNRDARRRPFDSRSVHDIELKALPPKCDTYNPLIVVERVTVV